MSYFNHFPRTTYSIDRINQKVVVDIMRGIKISENARENQKSFLDYRIPDGQRPEMLSHGVYDRSDFHWIPLLFNNIEDPYYDWPLSDNDLTNLIDITYSGMAFFLDVSLAKIYDGKNLIPKNPVSGSPIPFDTRIPHFEAGSKVERVVTTRNLSGDYTVTVENGSPVGEVVSWDPSFMKMIVKPVSGVWSLVGEAKRVRDNCAIGNCQPITVSNLSYDIRVTNSEGQQILCPLIRIVEENKNSIHHFESDSGEIISPMMNTTDKNDIPTKSSTLIYGYVMRNVESFDLTSLDIGRVNIVTNYEYEDKKNEAKRAIKMMRPEMIPTLLKQMKTVLGT